MKRQMQNGWTARDDRPSEQLLAAAFRCRTCLLSGSSNGIAYPASGKSADRQLFAIRFSDGEEGFVTVGEDTGGQRTVDVFVGREGRKSLWKRLEATPPEQFYLRKEWALDQNYLQIRYDRREQLSESEHRAAIAYGVQHDIQFHDDDMFPRFQKYQSACVPWPPAPEEEHYLVEAADAYIAMTSHAENHTPSVGSVLQPVDKALQPVDKATAEGLADSPSPLKVSMITDTSDSTAGLEEEPLHWPAPAAIDGIAAGRLRDMEPVGILECCVLLAPIPEQTAPGACPRYPHALFWADGNTCCPYEPIISHEYFRRPEQMVNHFLRALLKENFRPRLILVSDERTRTLLAPAAEMTGIDLEQVEELLCVEEIQEWLVGDAPE